MAVPARRSPGRGSAAQHIWRVFLSSTYTDLIEHRASVLSKLRQLGTLTVDMEDFGARDDRPKDECLRLIREETEIFVGVYANRYGFIPPGEAVSITELEYDAAVAADLPRFIYVLDDEHQWPVEATDDGPSAERLATLKRRLKADRIIKGFTTPDALAASVVADIGRYLARLANPDEELHGLVHLPPEDWVSPAQRNSWRYKVVAFDLDGTLLRGPGFVFSWELVWTKLRVSPAIQANLKREYRRRAGAGDRAERISAYRAWCEAAVDYYRGRRLTRDRIREIAAGVSLTRNALEALTRLREEGMVLAIVSGGIDTFLEDAFPNYRDYVDFVFINHLTFDAGGGLLGVVATAYDFEGKADALDLICQRTGCDSSEAVFAGDRFNDEMVMLRAGLGIAYPPGDSLVDTAANVAVSEDDLMSILPQVLVV